MVNKKQPIKKATVAATPTVVMKACHFCKAKVEFLYAPNGHQDLTACINCWHASYDNEAYHKLGVTISKEQANRVKYFMAV